MSCLRPKLAYLDERTTPARVLFKPPFLSELTDRLPSGVRSVSLPCGKCWACQRQRAFEITVRAVAESRCHDFSSFITLTVDNDSLPFVFPNGLEHRPWQLFAKRLRKAIGPFRFLMCGEYGSKFLRPHYHAIIYGHLFRDTAINQDSSCTPSVVLQRSWPFGFVQVSDASVNRIAYCAGYTLKDGCLGRDDSYWDSRGLGRPYVLWSRRPSLGRSYFLRYRADITSDKGFTFVLNGRQTHIGGRYFLRLLDLTDPDQSAIIRANRLEALFSEDSITPIMRHCDASRKAAFQIHEAQRKVQGSSL